MAYDRRLIESASLMAITWDALGDVASGVASIRQAPGQPKDCGILAVRVQPFSESSGDGHTAGDCQGGSGNCGPLVTLAAVHCSASMGIAYLSRQQSGPAAHTALLEDVPMHPRAAGADGRQHAQPHVRGGRDPETRAVHVQFLRQAVHDAAQPAICSFAAMV